MVRTSVGVSPGVGTNVAVESAGGIVYEAIAIARTDDPTLNVPVTADGLLVKAGHNVTGLLDGRQVVTTAGVRAALAVSTPAKFVTVTAETDNTGLIVIGGVTVVAALATRRGTPLEPGDTYTAAVDNLADLYIDAEVSGDGVTYSYLT